MSEMAGGPPGDMHIYEMVTAAFNVIGDVIFRLEVLSFVRRTWSLEPAWLQRDPSYKSTLSRGQADKTYCVFPLFTDT